MRGREHGWIYRGFDRDGVELYVGKHDGPHDDTRLRQHVHDDAEWTRHLRETRNRMVHRDDLLVEETISIKAANDGQGTVFNYLLNGQTTVPRREDYVDRYYDGYSDRYGDEEPDPKLAGDRRARAEDHPSYVSRKKRRRLEH